MIVSIKLNILLQIFFCMQNNSFKYAGKYMTCETIRYHDLKQ